MSNVSLDEIFFPRGIAVVGVSPEDSMSYATSNVIALLDAGFPSIYPVNPKYSEACGLKCYPTVSAILGVVDLVIVCIPAEKALDILDDCAKKGVKAVHFFTAGFGESGDKNREQLEKAVLLKAKASGIRIIGPNCVGLYVPAARVTNTTKLPMEPGHIGFISQSGGHSQSMPFQAKLRGLRFSKVISYGNALDIDECELLEYFTEDAETEIIAIYIEGVRNGSRFYDMLKRASRKKPVVIYKGGVTESGLLAAKSHTASLTSSIQVFRTLCRQLNTIQVDDIQEMIDVLVALCFAIPYPSGKGIVVVGQGGGPSVQASDQLESAGLCLPRIPSPVEAELRQFLPMDGAIFANPLDATNLTFPDAIGRTFKVLGKVKEVNMMMYHMGFHPVSRWGDGLFANDSFLKPMVETLHNAITEIKKPVIVALGPAPDKEGFEEFLQVQEAFVSAGLPVFHSLSKAGLAMVRVTTWCSRKGILT